MWGTILGWVGLVLHLATGLLYLASGLVAPPYGLITLWVIWIGLLTISIVFLRSQRKWRTIFIPIAAVVIWFGVLTLGERLLGWTA